ncbi:MAG: 50S ribosomal protein L19 [Candidatus Vogelbacteria bacterium]|nr:50S ribosomal protein L19 [Candidatus Vogelbacteria bacterium]
MSLATAFKVSSVDMVKRQKVDLRPGTTVRVWQKIQEKGKTRLQAYEGLVIARKHGFEPGATFTVRKVASGVGMEKIFPLYSPNIDKIEIVKTSKVRKAKLYYIRDKAAKEIRRRMKQTGVKAVNEDEELYVTPEEVITAANEVAVAEATGEEIPETETPAETTEEK